MSLFPKKVEYPIKLLLLLGKSEESQERVSVRIFDDTPFAELEAMLKGLC